MELVFTLALPMNFVAADVSPLHLPKQCQSRLTSAATVQGHSSWERWRLAGEFRFSAPDWPAGRQRSQEVYGEGGRITDMETGATPVLQFRQLAPRQLNQRLDRRGAEFKLATGGGKQFR